MSRQKRDPLIAAMIAKLPDGGEWPVERQLAWLNLMAMAFGTVYGGDAAARLGSSQAAAPSSIFSPEQRERLREMEQVAIARLDARQVAEKPKPRFPFYIDEQGVARNAAGNPVKPLEVKGELVDLRGMDGDVKTIRWADGSTGLNGADLTIVAA